MLDQSFSAARTSRRHALVLGDGRDTVQAVAEVAKRFADLTVGYAASVLVASTAVATKQVASKADAGAASRVRMGR